MANSIGCRYCGGANARRLQSPSGAFLRCTDCGALSRELTASEYDRLVVSYDTDSVAAAGMPAHLVREILEVDDKKRLLKAYAEARGGTFLDVGCGPPS